MHNQAVLCRTVEMLSAVLAAAIFNEHDNGVG